LDKLLPEDSPVKLTVPFYRNKVRILNYSGQPYNCYFVRFVKVKRRKGKMEDSNLQKVNRFTTLDSRIPENVEFFNVYECFEDSDENLKRTYEAVLALFDIQKDQIIIRKEQFGLYLQKIPTNVRIQGVDFAQGRIAKILIDDKDWIQYDFIDGSPMLYSHKTGLIKAKDRFYEKGFVNHTKDIKPVLPRVPERDYPQSFNLSYQDYIFDLTHRCVNKYFGNDIPFYSHITGDLQQRIALSPKPEENEKELNRAFDHMVHSFRTEFYLSQSRDRAEQKLFAQRNKPEGYDMTLFQNCFRFVLSQLGYDRIETNHETLFKRRPPFSDAYEWVEYFLNCNVTMVTSAGITIPLFQEGMKREKKCSHDPNDKRSYSFLKKDGRYYVNSGPKRHFLVHTLYFIHWLLENVPSRDLNPHDLFLSIPQFFLVAEKFESRKGYENKESVRLFYISSLFINIIESGYYYPFGEFIKFNMPFFTGYDWQKGAANDIFNVFSAALMKYSKVTNNTNLEIDVECHDIQAQDHSYLCEIIYQMQQNVYTLFIEDAFSHKHSLSSEDLNKYRTQGTEFFDQLFKFYENDDSFSVKLELMRDYCNRCNANPIVVWPIKRLVSMMTRLLPSGSKITGGGNTFLNSTCVPGVIKEAIMICDERNLEDPEKYSGLKRKLLAWYDIVIEYPNSINMGDNGLSVWPSEFRELIFSARKSYPLEGSLFDKYLKRYGFQTKRSESYVVFNYKARLYDYQEPSSPIDGVGDVPSFCQHYFLQIRDPSQGRVSIWYQNPNEDGYCFVPFRYNTDFFSKISPFAHKDDIMTYYLKLNSLCYETKGIDSRMFHMLREMSSEVRNYLMKYHKDAYAAYWAQIERLDLSSLRYYFDKTLGYYQLDELGAKELLSSIGKVKTRREVLNGLFQTSQKHLIKNVYSGLLTTTSLYPVIEKERLVDYDLYEFLENLAFSENKMNRLNKNFKEDSNL